MSMNWLAFIIIIYLLFIIIYALQIRLCAWSIILQYLVIDFRL